MQSLAVAPQRSSAVRAHKASQGACLICGVTLGGAARALDELGAAAGTLLAEAVTVAVSLTLAASVRLHAPSISDITAVSGGQPTTRWAEVRRAWLSRFPM